MTWPVMPNSALRILVFSVPVMLLLIAVGSSAGASAIPKMSENECIPKAGFGVIDRDAHVNLRSSRNELRMASGRWMGASRFVPQLVYVHDGVVVTARGERRLPAASRPKGVAISFKRTRVYFHDFRDGTACYYERQ